MLVRKPTEMLISGVGGGRNQLAQLKITYLNHLGWIFGPLQQEEDRGSIAPL